MSKTVPAARPAVNIKRAVYAMATTDGQSAEITMYGDIYEQHPTDWDGNPVEGEFVLLPEFMEDLEQIASCKDITIRMNSYGGDAGAAITLHKTCRACLPPSTTGSGSWRGAERSSPASWTAWRCPAARLSCAPATR